MLFQLTLAVRYLLGRKLRTFLTTLAVVFGVLVLFSLNTILPTFTAAFQTNVLAAFGQVDLTVTHKTGGAFPAGASSPLVNVDGVRAVDGYLSRTVNLPADFVDGSPQTLDRIIAYTLVGINVDTATAIRAYVVEQGRFLEAGDTQAAVITQSLADALGLTVGDSLRLPTTEGQAQLTIVGLRPARSLPGNEEVLVTLPQAQRLLGQPGLINTIDVAFNTTDEQKRTVLSQTIAGVMGPNYKLGGLSSGTEFFASLQVAHYVMNLFGVAALVMGGFIIFNSFRTVIVERRHDIGMLRALGANRGTILGIIVTEGFLQGLIGTLAGMALGYLVATGVLYLVGSIARQFINIQFSGLAISPLLVAGTLAIGIGVTVFSGLLPAIGASNITPLEALRPMTPDLQSPAVRRGTAAGMVCLVLALLGLASGNLALTGVGAVLCLAGLVLVAPVLVKPITTMFGRWIAAALAQNGIAALAEGNLTRQPARAAITASTTMIGLTVIVGMGALVTSIIGSFMGIMQRSLGSDYLLIPPTIGAWASNVGAGSSLAGQLRAVEGVGAVSGMRFAASSAPAPSTLQYMSGEVAVSLLGLDPVVYPQVASLTFEQGDPVTSWQQLASGRTIIVNGPMSSAFQLKVGDTINLATPGGSQTYTVVAIANDYLNAKLTTGYISHASMAADFHKTEDVFLQLNLLPGASRAVVEPKLKGILANYPQFSLVSGEDYFAQNQRLFYSGFGALYVLFAMLSLPSLIAILNTLAIGVLERTREIGMLRAVGATQRQVRSMVIAEAVLLAAIGTVLGLLGGLYLSYLMVSAIRFSGFTLTYQFPVYAVVSAIVMGMLFGVLAALIPARQAARLEIVQALRYE